MKEGNISFSLSPEGKKKKVTPRPLIPAQVEGESTSYISQKGGRPPGDPFHSRAGDETPLEAANWGRGGSESFGIQFLQEGVFKRLKGETRPEGKGEGGKGKKKREGSVKGNREGRGGGGEKRDKGGG